MKSNVPRIISLITGATAIVAGAKSNSYDEAAFQAVVDGTGALTGTVLIQVSNNGVNWDTMGTIALSGTTTASGSYSYQGKFAFVRANLTALSGTGATVNVTMSV